MKCSNCGAELAAGVKFCGECGAKVVVEEVAHIDPMEICGIFRRLKSQLKTNRMYFKGDGAFEMKCETLLKSAATTLKGMSASSDGFSATDMTLRFKGDEPRVVNVDKADFLVLVDNTKSGLFGGFDKRPCLYGGLVTTQGILAYNYFEKKKGYMSGFVDWSEISSLGPAANLAMQAGLHLFYKRTREYPNGPWIKLMYDRAGVGKRNSRYYGEASAHLWHILKGIEKPFDYDDYDGDPMGDAEDAD